MPAPSRSNPSKQRKVLLVDDHPLLLSGLERLIESEADLCVCGMTGDVQSALQLVEVHRPDLVIADLSLPGRNGMELIKDLSATHPDLPVIAFSMHDEMLYAERVLRAGGRGYVMKESPPGRLLKAIRVVLAGEIFISPRLNKHLLKSIATCKGAARPRNLLESLTDREMEVFEMLGGPGSLHEIAEALGISPRTLDAHRAHIREKLGLADSSELTRQAIRWAESGH
jgi:DNA-binding NarL/FixJ family response regulator